MGSRTVQEVSAAFADYLSAYGREDLAGINRHVTYPLGVVTGAGVVWVDSYPENPSALKQTIGWHSTADVDFEVVGATGDKAHVILRSARRLREDGSLIATISAFYCFARTADGWRFHLMSGLEAGPGETLV